MSFFSKIPAIVFWNKLAPNIMTRVGIVGDAALNTSIYHAYTVEDGDRPDTLAHYYYGNSDLDWLIMLANQIYDLPSQWPLNSNEFEVYMENKYGNVFTTYSEVDHYELAPNIANITTTTIQGLSAAEQKYWAWNDYQKAVIFVAYSYAPQITSDAYALLTVGEKAYWSPVSVYDTEYANNEAKRNIRLIDRTYSTVMISALEDAVGS